MKQSEKSGASGRGNPSPKSGGHWQYILIAAVIVLGIVLTQSLPKKPSDSGVNSQEQGNSASTESAFVWKTDNDMVWLPGGTFTMGNNQGNPDERPEHKVTLDGFWIDTHEVTNAQFKQFVEETGYVTVAEKQPSIDSIEGLDPSLVDPTALMAGSVCFRIPDQPVTSLNNHLQWWTFVPGANWRHPTGEDSSIVGKDDHPVVHVCYEDALAYCQWAGKRLPTEAEWEYACRADSAPTKYVWGDEMKPDGRWLANIWQGDFPGGNTLEDKFMTSSPVKTFPPNAFGLYDMGGNVWEWVSDWYRPDYYSRSPASNPQGPSSSYDPAEPNVRKRVTRGGSFLCSDVYCVGYRPSSRMKSAPDTGLIHTGFRCVSEAPAPESPSAD